MLSALLAFWPAAGAAQRRREVVPETRVTCSLSAETTPLASGAGAPVKVRLENPSGEAVELSAVYGFRMNRATEEAARRDYEVLGDSYWSPVDLATGGPLKLVVVEPKLSKKGVTVGRPPRAGVSLGPKESKEFALDLTRLHWKASALSSWPDRNLFDAVPAGEYMLFFQLNVCPVRYEKNSSGDIPVCQHVLSNQIKVTVEPGARPSGATAVGQL